MAARVLEGLRRGLSQTSGVHGLATTNAFAASRPEVPHDPIRHRCQAEAPVEGRFKGRHFEAGLIVQAVS